VPRTVLPVAEGKRADGRRDVDEKDQHHRVGLLEAERLFGIHGRERDDDADAGLVRERGGEQPAEVFESLRLLPRGAQTRQRIAQAVRLATLRHRALIQ
jgi:hypothetical protein